MKYTLICKAEFQVCLTTVEHLQRERRTDTQANIKHDQQNSLLSQNHCYHSKISQFANKVVNLRWDGYPATTRFQPGIALPGVTWIRPGITLKYGRIRVI